MSYSLNLNANIESAVSDNSLQTILNYNAGGTIEVENTSLVALFIPALTSQEVIIPNAQSLIAFAVSSDTPVDVCTTLDIGDNPYYTGTPCMFFMFVNPTGVVYNKLLIKASSEDANVRVAYAVNYS
jgi:hypothetical protein